MNVNTVFLRPRYMTYVARRQAFRSWARLSRSRRKKVLTVFDPSLKEFNGHHIEYARAIKEICGPTYDVRFYVNFRALTKILLSLRAQPICEESTYPPSGQFKAVYQRMTRFTVEALNRIDKRDVGPDAIFLMHTVSLYQLGGLAEWLLALPSFERPNLCLQFTFPLVNTASRKILPYGRAAALVATGKTRFAANSKLLADHISKSLEQACTALPHSLRWPSLNQTIEPEPGIVFGFSGGLRFEKGASLMARAIPEFAARYPETRFLVHAPSSESDPSAIEALEGVPQVELIRSNFHRKNDYFRQFRRASCILLPYDPVAYAYRPSGILIENLGLDRLIITTKESWCWAEAERYTDARNLLRSQPLKPKFNNDVIAENCPAAFCSALIQFVNS
jgi:hypothetical protein